MKKTTKIWLYVALLCITIGIGIFMLTACGSKSFSNNINTSTVTHEITEDFSKIIINSDTSDIVFIPTDDGICKIISTEHKKMKSVVNVKDGTMTLGFINEKKWYDYILDFGERKITVYLPKTEYDSLIIDESTGDIYMPKDFNFGAADIKLSTGDIDFCASVLEKLKINLSTGDVDIKNCSVGSLEITGSTSDIEIENLNCASDMSVHISTGEVELSDVNCANLSSTGSTGNIELERVVASGKLSIERSTGDIHFDATDAAEICFKTDTGNVIGSLLSTKNFICSTDTGNIRLPSDAGTQKCEIRTDTGDIEVTVIKK